MEIKKTRYTHWIVIHIPTGRFASGSVRTMKIATQLIEDIIEVSEGKIDWSIDNESALVGNAPPDVVIQIRKLCDDAKAS